MAGTPVYFGRKYRLTLYPPGQEAKVFEVQAGKPAMDIKFDVTYARGQTAREGTISILGLGHRTIHEFISLAAMARGEAMCRKVRVVLEAGYFSTAGMIQILNGFVWYATVTSPPQMWLNMKVSEYDPAGGKKTSFDRMQPLAMRPMLETVLARYSTIEGDGDASLMPFKVVDKTQDSIVDSSTETKDCPLLGKGDLTLGEAVQILSSDLSDTVSFTLRSSRIDRTRQLECLDKDKKKVAPGKIVKVDKDHGLLSVTGIDAVNGCITTFLDGRIDDELSHMVLTSELNQQANGKYYIIKKQYVGHFMGQEWYSRYFCSAREE